MNQKNIYFDVIRTNENIVTLKFDCPRETKLVFRAILTMVGNTRGISLIAKPSYCVKLARTEGAWNVWREIIAPYTTEVDCTTRYKITLIDGKISKNEVVFPIALYAGCP